MMRGLRVQHIRLLTFAYDLAEGIITDHSYLIRRQLLPKFIISGCEVSLEVLSYGGGVLVTEHSDM